MTNLNVIAKPYAKAAFEFASEKNLLQEWSSLFQTFAELINCRSVASIISSPALSQKDIITILKDQLDESFFNFLTLAAENKKLSIIPAIADQFESIKNTHDNSKVANIVLAYAADKALLDSLKAKLEQRFKCSINLNVSINPTIVGGAIVKIEGAVIDDSVSGRLEKLKSILLS